MESKKSSHAYGTYFLLISTIFLIFLSQQANSYQKLICLDLNISCAECKKQCDETSYGGICLNEGLKNETCCCKKSPPPSYYDPSPPPSI
ncbi:PREDICTED: putative defensin-like protein 79 [Camelina sativa]|uniref:Defensin-like protein 79 n=1 Tax=Camelina sativa TaxID=90675 RepID=A0ABM1QGA8_CAMSA|nr:PREDICTED: putative defensin-like protein 79 [Camelina sativa]